jgi:hypothetical protein
MEHAPYSPGLANRDCPFLDALRSTWLVSDLSRTPTRGKPSPQEYSYLAPISSKLGWMPWRLVETGP